VREQEIREDVVVAFVQLVEIQPLAPFSSIVAVEDTP
jgi:hypothetical protein